MPGRGSFSFRRRRAPTVDAGPRRTRVVHLDTEVRRSVMLGERRPAQTKASS